MGGEFGFCVFGRVVLSRFKMFAGLRLEFPA